VPFINSSALSVLAKLMHDLDSRDIHMYIMNVNETIKGLLDITGTGRHFKIIRNEDGLIDGLKQKELDDVLKIDE
jgi:anti-anti-sigma factor